MAACNDKTAAVIIDPIALGAIILLTLIMVFGVKESFWVNVATVVVSVVAILLCIFMGAYILTHECMASDIIHTGTPSHRESLDLACVSQLWGWYGPCILTAACVDAVGLAQQHLGAHSS